MLMIVSVVQEVESNISGGKMRQKLRALSHGMQNRKYRRSGCSISSLILIWHPLQKSILSRPIPKLCHALRFLGHVNNLRSKGFQKRAEVRYVVCPRLAAEWNPAGESEHYRLSDSCELSNVPDVTDTNLNLL